MSLPLASETSIGARRSLREVAAGARARPRGAYLHVPFCRHKCHYCDFYSFVDTQDRQGAFVERLERELDAAAGLIDEETTISTVFIGGGTPTLLRPPLLARMLAAVRRTLPLAPP